MPAFDIKALAGLVTPPRHQLLGDSAFDPGSPQYVRPEDMMLDIQSSLFGLRRKDKATKAPDPADFRTRWMRDGVPAAWVDKVGDVGDGELADATVALLRCSKRKGEHYPTFLPIVPAVGAYKNVSTKLPNYFNDQLRPLLTFGAPDGYAVAVERLCAALRATSQPSDTLLRIAESLLPLPAEAAALAPGPRILEPYDGPLVMDFSGEHALEDWEFQFVDLENAQAAEGLPEIFLRDGNHLD